MQENSPQRAAPVGTRLPTDRRTLACVALGGALVAVITTTLSNAPAWRVLAFDVRSVGLLVVAVLAGTLFTARGAVGDRWFAFLVFGVLAGFGSVGVYCLIALLGTPPSAGVRFLVTAPMAAVVGIGAGRALGRRMWR